MFHSNESLNIKIYQFSDKNMPQGYLINGNNMLNIFC